MQIKEAIAYLENNKEHRIASIYIRIKKMAINALKKQEEYENLEKQGLLLKLPCKVGDVVYVIVEECEEMYDSNSNYYCIYEEKFHPYMLEDIGEYVFLTKEEAEQALKKMQEGE